MSDERRIAEMRQRVDALGIEPWFYVDATGALHPHTVAEGREGKWTAVCAMTYKNDAARRDAEFIAHARQDVPFLLSRIDALTEQIERAFVTGYRSGWLDGGSHGGEEPPPADVLGRVFRDEGQREITKEARLGGK